MHGLHSCESLERTRNVTRYQQPGQKCGSVARCELAIERPAAAFKQTMQQLRLRKSSELFQPGVEDFGGNIATLADQHTMSGQQAEQFPGWRGQESGDDTVIEESPLRVRAWKTQQLPALPQRRLERQNTEDLRFFAAHEVRRVKMIAAGESRDYADEPPAQA